MCVPDHARPMGVGRGRLVQEFGQHRLGPPPTVGDVRQLEQVAGTFEPSAHPGEVRLTVREHAHQVDQDPEVVPELVELGVPDVQIDPLEGEQGGTAGVGEQQRPRIGAEGGGRIGGRLHIELDLLAAGRARGHQVLAVIGGESLHRASVPPDQGFGTEPGAPGIADGEAQRHLPPFPCGRDDPPDTEPGGGPRWTPRTAHRERLVLGRERVGGRNRFAVNVVGADLHGNRRPVAPGPDEFAHHPNDPAQADRVLRAHGSRVYRAAVRFRKCVRR